MGRDHIHIKPLIFSGNLSSISTKSAKSFRIDNCLTYFQALSVVPKQGMHCQPMDYQEALAFIRSTLAPRQLSYIEELVFRYSWDGKRYREMAQATGYEEGYLKDTGSRLWQALSESLGYQVTKKRLHFLLPEAAKAQPSPSRPSAVSQSVTASLGFPGSPLPFGSTLYIERPPVEELALTTLEQSGGLLRIMAPWRMGKTSLINHVLGKMQQSGQQTVLVDMRQADVSALDDLDSFLRWFCWSIGQQLNLECELDNHWFEAAGSKLNCTTYMQEQILARVNGPLIVALDTVHYLMEHPYIAKNFFTMLRSWYEQARVRPQWQKLRLILAHVADLDLPLQAHQSPFNVGLLLELPRLTPRQIHHLRSVYILEDVSVAEASSLQALVDLVGGHPYLLHLAFYWLQSGKLSLTQIVQTASTNQGIYREYLRRLWLALQQDEDLVDAFYEVLGDREPVRLPSKQAYALAGMGLVELMGYKVRLQCELYRAYFSSLLELECG